jgi:crossover junction endodeoxyribonuclease RusA
MDLPSMADAPFHCPPELVVDLPYPPSVNRLWRSTAAEKNRVYLSPSYVKWKGAADALLFADRNWHRKGKITGAFHIDISLCPTSQGHPRGDLDNRIKAVLDYLQRVEIIANDKNCQRLLAEWVDLSRAPHGCRVALRPLATMTMADVRRNVEALA